MSRALTFGTVAALGLVLCAATASAQFVGGGAARFGGNVSPGLASRFNPFIGSPSFLPPGIVSAYPAYPSGMGTVMTFGPRGIYPPPIASGMATWFGDPRGIYPPPISSGWATWFVGPSVRQVSPAPMSMGYRPFTVYEGTVYSMGGGYAPMFRGPRGTNPPPISSGWGTWFGR